MFGLPSYLDAILRGFVLGALALGFVVIVVRIVGLRSFSKMTSFDFVITLATGSLLAAVGTISNWTVFLQILVAIATLMSLQVVLARTRRWTSGSSSLFQNDPLLLMRDGEFDDEALRRSRVSRHDVIAKLRQANALDLDKVRAVVLETTGDISVLHGDDFDDRLIEDVERYDGRKGR